MKKHKRKNIVYMAFIDFKVYDRVNREALRQVLRIYDWDGKLSGMKTMYVDSLAFVSVKGGESERFMIDSGLRQGCIMSL